MPSTPVADPGTGTIDTKQRLVEAIPVAKSIALFGALALVPLEIAFPVSGASRVGTIFVVVAQFVLAVGASIVLLYVVARADRLADEC